MSSQFPHMLVRLESKLVLGLDKGSPFGVRYHPHYLVAACGMETTASAKETLRKFFVEHADTELTKGDVEQWLKTLAVAVKKKDIYEAAEKLTE